MEKTKNYEERVVQWKEFLGPDKLWCLEQLFINSGHGRPPKCKVEDFRSLVSGKKDNLQDVLDELIDVDQLIETHSVKHENSTHYYRLVADAIHLIGTEETEKRISEMAEIYHAFGSIYREGRDGSSTFEELSDSNKAIRNTSKKAMYFLVNLRSVLIYKSMSPRFPYKSESGSKIELSEHFNEANNFWDMSVRFAQSKNTAGQPRSASQGTATRARDLGTEESGRSGLQTATPIEDDENDQPYTSELVKFFSSIHEWTTQHSTEKFGVFKGVKFKDTPHIRLASWKKLGDLLGDRFIQGERTNYVFRGQKDASWTLDSSLARDLGMKRIPADYREQHFKNYLTSLRGRIDDISVFDEPVEEEKKERYEKEIWALGQHHYLNSPLLDWSKSPYVALFFAFENEAPDVEYRTIFMLNRTVVEEHQREVANPLGAISKPKRNIRHLEIFEPRIDRSGRLVSQAGLFTIGSNEEFEGAIGNIVEDSSDPTKFARHFCKILIPNEDRENCLEYLERMNVHHGSLFPDLEGAGKYANYTSNKGR